jgi:hypothetical protein
MGMSLTFVVALKTKTLRLGDAAALILIAFTAFARTSAAQWQASPGTELNIQALLATQSHTFAGGSAGVYVSRDAGESFTPSNRGNDSNGPTRGFAVISDIVFTCTSQGVFRSDDNGSTWEARSTGLSELRTSGMIYAAPYLIVATQEFFVPETKASSGKTQGSRESMQGVSPLLGMCYL